MAPKRSAKKPAKKPPSQKKTTKSASDIQYSLIQSRMSNYKLDVVKEREGWEIDTSSTLKALKNYGIVINHEENQLKYWVCLANAACAESCENQGWRMNIFKNEKNAWVTSNINRHLRDQHGIMTEGSEKQAQKSMDENQYRHELRQAFKNRMSRLGELQWVLMMILCRLPIAFGSYKVVKDTMALTGIDELKRNLNRLCVQRVISEIYSQTLTVARQQIIDAKKAHGNRIFSLNVDNWKSKNSIRKFMGVRACFLDHNMTYQNWMLAVREFKPSSQMRQGPTGLRRAMSCWALAILKHYGINFEDIFGATTDKAGDVRILNQLDIEANWEWCIPHLLNCILYYAFSLDLNPWMNAEIKAMKRAVNSIRDLTKDGNLFEETLIEENPEAAHKLLSSHQEQRFMGVYLTCRRYYEMFESINETCLAAGIVNQVKMTKVEIKQLISVLQPLRDISVKSQTQKSAYGYRVLQKLIHERLEGVLNPVKSVPFFDEKEKCFLSLCPGVARTRKLLVDGFDKKFLKRYFQKTKVTKSGDVTVQSYLLECQHLLHPALRNLDPVMNVIEHLVENDSIAIVGWTTKNQKASVRHAESLLTRNLSNRSLDELSKEYMNRKKIEYISRVQNDIYDTVKNHIIDTIVLSNPEEVADVEVEEVPRQRDLQCSSFEQFVTEQQGGSQEPEARRAVQSVVRRVSHCLESYLKAKSTHPAFRNHRVNCNFVEWAQVYGGQFFDVVSCFPAYFAVPISSAGIELDFYFTSLLLTKQRMSMKAPLIEMMQMIDRNRKWVDLTQVGILSPQEALAVQPNFMEVDEYVCSEDEEDMSHALEESEEERDDEEYENYDMDVEEKRRVDSLRNKNAAKKKKEEEYLVAQKKQAEESIRFDEELRKNLLAKKELADQRTLERLKHEKRNRQKQEKEADKKKMADLEKEMRQHQLKTMELEKQAQEQREAQSKQDATRNKLTEEEEWALELDLLARKRTEEEATRKRMTEEKKREMELDELEQEEADNAERKKSEEAEEENRVRDGKKVETEADRCAREEDIRLAWEKNDRLTRKENFRLTREKEEKDRLVQEEKDRLVQEENERYVQEEENRLGGVPNYRLSVKQHDMNGNIEEGAIRRREVLEAKRSILKDKIIAAGRRIDIIYPLAVEQQSIEDELGIESEHTRPRVATTPYVNTSEDTDEWDDASEYKLL